MYKSFKFVLFNESFPNLAKFQIRPDFGRSRISAGFVKKGWISASAELRYSPSYFTVFMLSKCFLRVLTQIVYYVKSNILITNFIHFC